MTSQVLNGERLVDLRDILGLSQSAVAERLCVNQASVSLVERGERPLTESMVSNLSDAFAVPYTFFLVPSELIGPVTFRKKASASVKDEKRVTKKYREAARLFKTTSTESGFKTATLPHPGDFEHDASTLADEVRATAGLGADDPVLNMTRLLERLGVGVISPLEHAYVNDDLDDVEASQQMKVQTETSHVSISCPQLADGRPLVALVAKCSGDRARYSLAHELGHLIYDRRLTRPIRGTRSHEELVANSFASALLVPDSVMRRNVSESLTLHGYLTLKAKYGMSVAALIARAERLGLISRDRARSLHIQRSSQGWSRNEPVAVPPEKTLLFQQSYRRVFPGTSNEQVAQQVGIMESLLDDWIDSLPASTGRGQVVSLSAWRQRSVA